MSLPVVPAGVNPFTIYRDSLETQLYYGTPPPSFKRRIIALIAICSYGALISAVYGLVVLLQQRAKSSEDRRRYRWIASRVDGYICLNLHTTVWGLGILSSACMFVYSLGEFYVFQLQTRLGLVNTYRSFVWIAIVLQGFLVSAASFQSFLIVASRAGQRVPSPRAANSTFLVALFAITTAMIATDTALAIGWQSVWCTIVDLRTTLELDAASWTAETSDVLELLGLLDSYHTLSAKLAVSHNQQLAMLAILIVGCFLVALANVGSLLLLLAIRRQIRETRKSLQALGSPLSSTGHVSFNITTVIVALPLRRAQTTAETEDATTLDVASRGSSHAIACALSPALGGESKLMTWDETKKDDSDKWWAAKSRRKSSIATVSSPESDGLKALKRAERELIVCAVCVFFFSISYAGEVMWDTIILSQESGWYTTELSYFFPCWIFALGFAAGATALAALATRDLLHIRRQKRARLSVECLSPGGRSARASVARDGATVAGLGVLGV